MCRMVSVRPRRNRRLLASETAVRHTPVLPDPALVTKGNTMRATARTIIASTFLATITTASSVSAGVVWSWSNGDPDVTVPASEIVLIQGTSLNTPNTAALESGGSGLPANPSPGLALRPAAAGRCSPRSWLSMSAWSLWI